MELFVIIVNSFQSLTIITKCSILGVAAVLDPPLRIHLLNHFLELKYSKPSSWYNVSFDDPLIAPVIDRAALYWRLQFY